MGRDRFAGSHQDEKLYREHAIIKLRGEYDRLQARLDAMYIDKLDGQIDAAFFDRKATEWRADQDRILRDIADHQAANRTYIDEGIRLLELAKRAHDLFMKQEPREKRPLLNFVVSNCTWMNGQLQATYRQPFDMMAVSAKAWAGTLASNPAPTDLKENWQPRVRGSLVS